MSKSIDPQLILSHTGWLRSLAAELVSNAQDADDLVQETWLTALRSPPRVLQGDGDPAPGLRAWLSRVLRNRARLAYRSRAHRTQREEETSRQEATSSVAESVERAAIQRELMEAVLALPENWRDVVVLRYLDELPPREIARRLELSPNVVSSRLHRALEALRQKLDEERGNDGRTWCLALLPLLSTDPVRGGASLGALFMKSHSKLLLTAVCALVLVVATRVPALLGGSGPEPEIEVAELAPRDVRPPAQSQLPVAGTEESQRETAVSVPGTAATEAPVPQAAKLNGRVRDPQGEGIAGVELVHVRPGGGVTSLGVHTAEDGHFTLPHPGAGRLRVDAPDWVTLLEESLPTDPTETPLDVVVSPRRHYSGTVVDQRRHPIQGAGLVIALDPARLAALRPGVQRDRTPMWTSKTDEQGRFSLDDVAWMKETILLVRKEGYSPVLQPLENASAPALLITLEQRLLDEEAIRGTVLHGDGSPASGARVWFGSRVALADGEGQFRVGRDPSARELIALKQGSLPGRLPREQLGANPTLLLGPPALTIGGRVFDADGQPVVFAKVWSAQATPLPNPHQNLRTIEDVIGEVGDATASSRHMHTNSAGLFALTGLLDQEYLVHALHPETGEIQSQSLQAGTRADFRFGSAETRHRVSGRVLSLTGEPLPGMRMILGRNATSMQPIATPWLIQGAPTTDENGAFAFQALAIEGTWLRPTGEKARGKKVFLDRLGKLEDIEIRLEAICQVQLILEGPDAEADRVLFLDEKGNAVPWSAILGQIGDQETYSSVGGSGAVRITEGRTEILSISEVAKTMRLMFEEEVLRETPLSLVPGEVLILR